MQNFKISSALFITGLILSGYSIDAQCVIDECLDVELEIPNCEALSDLDYLIELQSDCELLILDSDGNEVPNPIPNDPRYLCETLTVIYSDGSGGDSCASELLIRMGEGPRIITVPFTSISAQNYNAGNVPRPRVEDCTRDNYSFFDITDEFIPQCDQVPRVVRTYHTFDKCGNETIVRQTFDIIADLACTITGPARIRTDVPTLVRSLVSPRGLPPFRHEWSVNGKDWTLNLNKIDPNEVTLIPQGPDPGDAELVLDVFDRLGCKTTCRREFSAITNGRPFLSNLGETQISMMDNDHLQIRFKQWDVTHNIRILSLSGQVLYKGIHQASEVEIPVGTLSPGLYILHLSSGKEITSQKFLKT
jgi:hypothetical protein